MLLLSPWEAGPEGRGPTQTCAEPTGRTLSYFSLPGPDLLSLGLQLKHCEDPVVIDDGDVPGPQDLEQERVSAESQSNPDAQPVALAQGLGLLSRPPGQPTEDPGMEPVMSWVAELVVHHPCALVLTKVTDDGFLIFSCLLNCEL